MLRLGIHIGSFLLFACALGACSEDDPPVDPPRVEATQPLLPQAIEALGGRERLRSVETLALVLDFTQAGRTMAATIHFSLPDSYRHDLDTGDALITHATDGDRTWATLDGVPVPLQSDEIIQLREQLTMVQLSLLVGLEDEEVAKVTEEGSRDGLDWLEVSFRKQKGGPYALGFHPKTRLLVRAEWKTAVIGQGRNVPVALAVDDYRFVDGLMVPFAATFSVDEQVAVRDHVRKVTVNGEIPAGLFEEPTRIAIAPIVTRSLAAGPAVVIAVPNDKADDAERILLAYGKEHGLIRNSPRFRIAEDNRESTVGFRVHVERKPPTPVASPSAPRLIELPETRVLSTVARSSDESELRAAEKRLLAEIGLGNRPSVGPFRYVFWNDDIVQVQVVLQHEDQ